MFNEKDLLLNEYFPSELPPCFNTIDLANKYNVAFNALPSLSRNYSIPLVFSGYKSESSRRKFAIPNPYHYCKTIKLIVDNENELKQIFLSSDYSLTAPIEGLPKKGQPYAKRSTCIYDSKKAIEECFQYNKYEIRLDINSFFDNIYTHSIPWAIHGVAFSKTHRKDNSLLGNKLDSSMRSLNYDQTNGILVGNAASRIISELLLCTIDKQIKDEFPDIQCCRFVDDYYIYTTDNAKTQQIIAFVRKKLAQYELNFNENKIQINESPFIYGKPWVGKIKQYIHLSPDVFLSKLIVEYMQYKDITIFKYGLKILYQCKFDKKDWPAMQSRLINLWVRFPSLSNLIIKILLKNKASLKTSTLKRAIYNVIDESILLNREQELIWAIWFVKVFELTISQEYIFKIFETSNELAIIILLSIIDKFGRRKEHKIKSRIEKLHNDLAIADIDDKGNTNTLMWSSHWLLAYEATKNKWLNLPNKPFEYAKKNTFFKVLIDNDIKFFDQDYTYSLNISDTNYEFATKGELYDSNKKLKQSIVSNIKKLICNQQSSNSDIDIETANKIIDEIENGDDFYI